MNSGDEHVTIPDGRGGALIVPAGCEVVESPDGALVALPRQATAPAVVSFDDDPDDALSAIVDGLIADGSLAGVPADGMPSIAGETLVAVEFATVDNPPPDAVADEVGPFTDAPLVVADVTDLTDQPESSKTTTVAPPDEPATTKRRRGGTAA